MAGVADVVRRFGPAYLTLYGASMPPSHQRALRDIVFCRTQAMGGHVSQCDACGAEHYVYHSCRSRSCPTCHGAITESWLAAREKELLPSPYFHVVFTLPSELRELVRSNQRKLLGSLMSTAAESLQALARDPHYVGGQIGILAVLHTWTRAMVYHPHVHCLVPGGALAADAVTWRPARGDFLVPVRALSVRFRARFLTHLKRVLPDAVIPASLWTKPWVVYCKPTVQGSELVLRYLARYVHRVAITNSRIVAVSDKQVTFRYKDAREGWRVMTLAGEEFLRRFLQHVLPHRFHKVRYYGLWRPGAGELRARLQRQLSNEKPADPEAARSDANELAISCVERAAPRCPSCSNGNLHVIRRLLRSREVVPTAMPP